MSDKPSVGFVGLGIMGTAMASRLVDAGYKVIVWNRSKAKCEPLVGKGAVAADSPKAVLESTAITFACLSDPESARMVVFGEDGVLAGVSAGKGYVDMSTVDEDTAKDIGAAITSKGGRFLEAPVSGSKGPAEQGKLVILAAGDAGLKDEAQPCFDVMGKRTFFLGEVGAGARMKLVVNMMMGINMAALSEGLALGTKGGLEGKDILEVLSEGALACPMYALKGPKVLADDYAPNFPLKHQQKDLRLAVALGDKVQQATPVAAAANEVFKSAAASGLADEDMSAVFASAKR